MKQAKMTQFKKFKDENGIWNNIAVSQPEARDAMILQSSSDEKGNIQDWMGLVMVQFRGTAIPAMVMSAPGWLQLVPLVDDGHRFSEEVTLWKPWPRISAPLSTVISRL